MAHQSNLATEAPRKDNTPLVHTSGQFCRRCDLIETLRGVTCCRKPGIHHHLRLSDLATAPTRTADLCESGRTALLVEMAALLTALAAATSEHDSAATSNRPISDTTLLKVEQAAAKLAVTPEWLYRRGKRLGLAVKLGDATLRFSNTALEAYIRQHTAGGGGTGRRRTSA
jgi:hypothetical protein